MWESINLKNTPATSIVTNAQPTIIATDHHFLRWLSSEMLSSIAIVNERSRIIAEAAGAMPVSFSK